VFQFTIRDLFWLLLVASLGASWWVAHRNARHFEAERNHLSVQLLERGADYSEELAELRRTYERR
jgi:hypothetical protein